MTTWSELGYWQAVQGIASDAIAEYPNGTDNDDVVNHERHQFVSESVDSNEYVINYGANEIALRATNNKPDDINPIGSDWRTHRSLSTYLAMEMDVLIELDRLVLSTAEDTYDEGRGTLLIDQLDEYEMESGV